MTGEVMKEQAGYCKSRWADQCSHSIQTAEDVLNRKFLFDLPWDMEQTTEPVIFTDQIDWQYMPGGDPEFIYQFNRHRYWICMGQAYALTGNEAYAACFKEQLLSWISENPITESTKKTTWRTIEAGIRGENWCKAIEYFESSPHMGDEEKQAFIKGLLLHGEYLFNCRVLFSDKSNWGVLENHGLFCIGAFLSKKEWAIEESSRKKGALYIEEALKRLKRELAIQVMDDGVHWEQSPMYHNEVLRCILEVLRVAELYEIPVAEDIENAARAMAMADLLWSKPDHTQPANGDSDRTDLRDVLTPAAWLLKDPLLRFGGYDCLDFESAWEMGMEAVIGYEQMTKETPQNELVSLEASGQAVLRSGWDQKADYLHFMCGSLGGGHGHFGKLHLDLSYEGEDMLIDTGRYTYVDGTLRRTLKSAKAHNVPIADDREYTECTGSWNVRNAAAYAGMRAVQKGQYTLFEGAHLGYMDAGVYVCRKVLSIGTKIQIIADSFYGFGEHVCSQHFHLNPAGQTTLTKEDQASGLGFSYQGIKTGAKAFVLMPGAEISMEQGLVSFHYNQLTECPWICIRKKMALPGTLITVIFNDNTADASLVPVTVPVTGEVLKDQDAQALRIRMGDHSYLAVFNHRETGADMEYIGADGHYGLGRVMICEENQPEPEMTVLSW